MSGMKKEDPIASLSMNTQLSVEAAVRVMNDVFEDRDTLFTSRKLTVKTSPIHGRGVFAAADITANSILEECHFIQLKEMNFAKLDETLKDYVFVFPRGAKGTERTYAIPLGLGSIINHAHDNPNATWTTNESRWLFVFTALRDIQAGEEILIDYDRE